MKQVMIPNIQFKNQYWVIENGKNIKEISERFEYYLGNISNIIFDVYEFDEKDLKFLKRFSWIKNIMIIKNDEIIKIFKK